MEGPAAAWRIASVRCSTSTKQAGTAMGIKMKMAKMIHSMMSWPRESRCAHTFQSRVSGSSMALTRVFVRWVVKAEPRLCAGSSRVVAAANGMIVAGIEAFQVLILKVVRWLQTEPDESFLPESNFAHQYRPEQIQNTK
jgi:hypothetical protein